VEWVLRRGVIHWVGRGSDAIVAIGTPGPRTVRFQEMAHRDNVVGGEANIDGWGTPIE
jgi:hypothetical protein